MDQTVSPLFRLHPQARVFRDGGTVASRAAPAPMRLVARPVRDALPGLLAAFAAGEEFCVHANPEQAQRMPTHGTPGFVTAVTSGTTGAPKRVRRSHGSWIASFRVNAELFGLRPDDRYAVLGGLEHSLTLYATAEALYLGAGLNVLSGLRPDRQWSGLERASVLYATPAQLRLLCAVGADRTQPGLRLLLVGGGFLDAATRAEAARAFPTARIHAFYGASESSFIALSDESTPDGSVGRPYPGVEISVRDMGSAVAAVNEIGEIWVRSPYLFDGYAGATSPDTVWQDGFLTVGELGRIDAEGHLFLTGRKSRMFTVADRNCLPEEVEALLLGLPGVAEAAVLPRPDTRRGQVPVAFLWGQLAETDRAALEAGARAKLDPLFVPREIRILADWPRLASGKTDLRALEALL
jgi:long-chain acyl-CoA synthetase